jgi:hemerythrin-like domain-containing protein
MNTICDYLANDHQLCDKLFRQTQTSIGSANWDKANSHFRQFEDVLKQHIRMEEKVLFPAFLRAIRHGDGPLSMLRVEHQRMQAILKRMEDALLRFDANDFFLHAESLALLMEQHHMKEEEILYPLLDRALAERRQPIIRAMCECLEYRAGCVAI